MSIESLTPLTREELFLEKIIGRDVETPTPKQRIELFLAKIAGEDVELPVPATRIELFLAKIAGEDVALPEPATREELFLGNIAGMDIALPEPKTREEWYLYQWAEGGSGVLKTVTGALLQITDALARKPKELTVDIPVVQEGDGDPAPDNIRPFIGYLGASVTQTGENIFDEATATIYKRYLSYDNYNWKSNSDSRSYSILCKPNTRYVISASNENISIFRVAYSKLETWTGSPDIPIFSYAARTSPGSLTIVTGAEAKRLVIQLSASVVDSRSGNVTIREASQYTFAFPNKNLYNADKVTSGYYKNETGDNLKSDMSCISELIPVVSGQTYTFSGTQSATSNLKRIHGYYNGAWQTQITSQTITAGEFAITFQIPNGINQIVISSYNTDTNRQLELGDTATEYEEQDVYYGGTLDVVTGKVSITHIMMNISNFTWSKVNSNNFRNFYTTPQRNPLKYIADKNTVFSSHYKAVNYSSGTTSDGDNYIWAWYNSGNPAIAIKDTSNASKTAAEFKQYLLDNNVQIVHELETPIEYQLPKQQAKLFLGENNISADTNSELELTYFAVE